MMSVAAGTCSLVWRDQCQVMGGFLHQQHLLQQHDITTDVTIVSDDGLAISAHSIVLAACSPFFSTILKSMTINDLSISILDTTSSQLQSILSFIYQGETTISKDSINNFLTLAHQLQISCFNKNQKIEIGCPDDDDDLDRFDFFLNEEEVPSAHNEDVPILIPPLDHKPVQTNRIRTNLRKEKWIVTKKNARRYVETHFSNQNFLVTCGKTDTKIEVTTKNLKKHQNIAEIKKSSCLIPLVDHKSMLTDDDLGQFDFFPIEEEVSSVGIIKDPPILIPSVNHKTMLSKLIRTKLRKELEDEKIYWHCLCCNKRWNVTRKNAYRHMETHLPKQNCVTCGKTFKNTEDMKRHSKKEHNISSELTSLKLMTGLADMKYDDNNNDEQFSMDVNDDVDSPIRNANMKITKMHSYQDQKTYLTSFKMIKLETEIDGKWENSWQCLICGKSWDSKTKCRRHMEAHMVGLEFPCELCNKVFNRKRTLKTHTELCKGKLMENIVEDILGMVEFNQKERNMKEGESS